MRKPLNLVYILVLFGACSVISACAFNLPVGSFTSKGTAENGNDLVIGITRRAPTVPNSPHLPLTPVPGTVTASQPTLGKGDPSFTSTLGLTRILPTTPTGTPVPTRRGTATWVLNHAGKITAPILLYHHILDGEPPNRYYVSVASFRQQMGLLKYLGYSTVTPSQLVSVLLNGGELPAHPIVITFDDGNLDIYHLAFPIMKEYGFVGAFYIVANRLESDGFIHVDQLKEMAAAGWEIGSHSMSHPDLIQNHTSLKNELLNSRLVLEKALGVSVTSFAYPYGLTDDYILKQMRGYGYTNGMGLGILTEHTMNSRFYLNRRVVERSLDLNGFTALLPWQGNPTPTIP